MYIVQKPIEQETKDMSSLMDDSINDENVMIVLEQPAAPFRSSSFRQSADGKNHVSFGVVEIREYPIIMGDHPTARFGAPLTIDWEYEEAESMSVVDYDALREPEHRYKKMRQMRMSPYYRRTLLRELQYSSKEVKQRDQEMLKIQRQRKTTKLFVGVQKQFEEKFRAKKLFNNNKDSGNKKKMDTKRKTGAPNHHRRVHTKMVVPVMSDEPKKSRETRRVHARSAAGGGLKETHRKPSKDVRMTSVRSCARQACTTTSEGRLVALSQ